LWFCTCWCVYTIPHSKFLFSSQIVFHCPGLFHSLWLLWVHNLGFLTVSFFTVTGCRPVTQPPFLLWQVVDLSNNIIFLLWQVVGLSPNLLFLLWQVVSLSPNLQPGGPIYHIYNPRAGLASHTPRHGVPILVAFYSLHGWQWNCSLPRLRHREIHQLKTIKRVMNSQWSDNSHNTKFKRHVFKILNTICGENFESSWVQVIINQGI
jgi:hypothetical protein